MRRRDVLIAAAVLAACSPPQQQKADATPAAAGADDPAAVIRPLYARYLRNSGSDNFPPMPDRAPWSASLRQALVADEARWRRTQEVDPDGLDFDPFVNAQDWLISDVNVTTDSVVPQSHAVVRASFSNAGTHEEVAYDMVWEDGGWRVDNMRSGGPPDGWDLRQLVNR